MRNFLICVTFVAAAMIGPFLWAWWIDSQRPIPDASIASAPTGEDDVDSPDLPPARRSQAKPDDVEPPSANPMIDALRQLLSDSPAFDEHGDELREQLDQADTMLAKIKAENREALDRLRKGANVRRGSRRQSRTKPNLIVIDLGRLSADSLHCYNAAAPSTPVFDHLAAQGVRFNRFYRSTVDADLDRSRFVFAEAQATMEAPADSVRQKTLPARLVKSGYQAAIIGNANLPGADPHKLGFDAWFGAMDSRLAETAWPRTVWADGAPLKLILDEQERYDSQTIYMTEAFSFAERMQTKQPFFLWLSLPLPDLRYPASHDDAVGADVLPMETQLSRIEQQLIAWIKDLNERKIANNSIVVLTSLTAPRLLPEEDPFSERRMRAPLIVLGPNRLAANRVNNAFCTAADLAATLAEAADLPKLSADAVSLYDLLRKGSTDNRGRQRIVWRQGADETVVFDHWRYERSDGATKGLFDLDSADAAAKNVAGLHPQVVVRAKQHLKEVK